MLKKLWNDLGIFLNISILTIFITSITSFNKYDTIWNIVHVLTRKVLESLKTDVFFAHDFNSCQEIDGIINHMKHNFFDFYLVSQLEKKTFISLKAIFCVFFVSDHIRDFQFYFCSPRGTYSHRYTLLSSLKCIIFLSHSNYISKTPGICNFNHLTSQRLIYFFIKMLRIQSSSKQLQQCNKGQYRERRFKLRIPDDKQKYTNAGKPLYVHLNVNGNSIRVVHLPPLRWLNIV